MHTKGTKSDYRSFQSLWYVPPYYKRLSEGLPGRGGDVGDADLIRTPFRECKRYLFEKYDRKFPK